MKEIHYIESDTEKGVFYKVTKEEVTKTEYTCSCKGFNYNGKCKHIDKV